MEGRSCREELPSSEGPVGGTVLSMGGPVGGPVLSRGSPFGGMVPSRGGHVERTVLLRRGHVDGRSCWKDCRGKVLYIGRTTLSRGGLIARTALSFVSLCSDFPFGHAFSPRHIYFWAGPDGPLSLNF